MKIQVETVISMLKYLGIIREPNGRETLADTTFELKFVEDNKLSEIKFGELTRFMSGYYSSLRPQTSITWKLTYNFDSSITIRLKFHYPDMGWLNDRIKQERFNTTFIREFEDAYIKNFSNIK